MDLEKARLRLAEERARIERELAGHGEEEATDDPKDSGDQANELEQTDTDNALRADLRQTLEAIEKAEARLEEGTYGKSVVSGDPIPDERLEAIPWAERNVDEEPGGRG
jgi:RNA polymerase-binding transcription factor